MFPPRFPPRCLSLPSFAFFNADPASLGLADIIDRYVAFLAGNYLSPQKQWSESTFFRLAKKVTKQDQAVGTSFYAMGWAKGQMWNCVPEIDLAKAGFCVLHNLTKKERQNLNWRWESMEHPVTPLNPEPWKPSNNQLCWMGLLPLRHPSLCGERSSNKASLIPKRWRSPLLGRTWKHVHGTSSNWRLKVEEK